MKRSRPMAVPNERSRPMIVPNPRPVAVPDERSRPVAVPKTKRSRPVAVSNERSRPVAVLLLQSRGTFICSYVHYICARSARGDNNAGKHSEGKQRVRRDKLGFGFGTGAPPNPQTPK
eukprot:Em0020g7a